MKTLTADGRARMRVLLVVVLATALALAGAAKVGYAGTGTNGSLTTTIQVLNENHNSLILGDPTPGGNVGYEINVSNGSTNTINHLQFTDTIAGSTVVYLTTTGTGSCTGLGTVSISCSSSQLAAGAQLDVIVLFATPSTATAGSPFTNILDGSYAPQSNNTSNNRTDPTKQFHTETGSSYAGGAGQFLAQSLLLPFDQHGQGKLTVGGVVGQSSGITMPASTFFGANYVGTSIQTTSGLEAPPPANCPVTCQPFETTTTIPTAPVFSTSNPFIQGTNTKAYTWTMTIPVPNSFKPSGVYHVDDQGNGGILPKCTVVNNVAQAPTTAPGLCVSGISLNKQTNPHQATYTGLGVNNGHGYGF